MNTKTKQAALPSGRGEMLDVCPPNSKDAEISVLGAVLQDKRSAVNAFGELTGDDFYFAEHREIFSTLAEMHRKKQTIDIMTASDELYKRGTLEGVGGSAYLLSCCRYVPTTANSGAYVKIVKDKAMLRNIISKCREAETQCYTQGQETDEIIDVLRTDLRNIERGGGELSTLADVMSQTFDYIVRRSEGKMSALMTGIPALDRMTGGLMPGNLMIVGARPSVGKSVVGMDIAMNVCKTKHVLVVSREMCDLEYGLRILSNGTLLSGSDLKVGNVGEQQWDTIVDAMNNLTHDRLKFDFRSTTIEKISTVAKIEHDKNTLDLIVVDYLQLVDTANKSGSRYIDVGAVSRGLKDLAGELRVPIIAMAQVGRGADKRCPSKADLRESGNIEQDADIIVFLHEPEDADDPDIPALDLEAFANIVDQGRRYLIAKVDKQRMGAKGSFGIDFNPNTMTLVCVDTWKEYERSA